MSPTFRKIREKSRNPMTSCFLCRHPFEDGEMMWLASFKKEGNRTLCKSCSKELLESVETRDDE